MELDIGILGAAALEDGVPAWQVNVAVGNDNNDVEPCGEVAVFQPLGFNSMPAPKDGDGHAEALFARDVAGRSVVVLGGRDARQADRVGKMGPGDTGICATGPKATAQVQCKAKKRQVFMAVDDAQDKTMMLLLDGKNKKAQWAARGAMVEISEDGDISIVNKEGSGILIQGNKIHIVGELALPGMTPGFALMQGLPAGQVAGPAAVLLTPVQGVGK